MRVSVTALTLICVLFGFSGCGESGITAIDPATGQVLTFETEAEIPAGWITCEGACDNVTVPGTLENGANARFLLVYQAEVYSPRVDIQREWVPMDVTPSTHGELWVIQRMRRSPDFDEFTECTSRSRAGSPNDCLGLQGSTVGLQGVDGELPVSSDRTNLVVDSNSLHFMRRPAGIAFGVAETTLLPSDPRSLDPDTGEPLISQPLTYTDIFATCAEHWTGNFTDGSPFIGPSLWTADPEIYNGSFGSFAWSNGSHLDMVHATQNCVGIAWERDNVYWVINGEEGTLDRYDFGSPHYHGAADHSDGEVTRYTLDSALSRVPDVPSNMVMEGANIYVADTGNGRVVRFDTAQTMTPVGTFQHFGEPLEGDIMSGVVETVVDRAALAAAWGETVEPSGLAILNESTLVVASHGTGHLSLVSRDGELVRTIDTGLGAGIGGLTVMNDKIYFAHMGERRIFVVDVDESPILIVPTMD